MFLSEYPSLSLFRKHGLGTFLSLLLLSACSPDNDALPGDGGGNTSSAELRIEVSASDFAHIGGTNTRATDNISATTFEKDDIIGIIVLDNSGKVLSNNIPYKCSGTTWRFDKSNREGKTTLYYDNKATKYIAYFPYNKEVDVITGAGITTDADILAALKAKFQPQYDQRTEDAYRASDLLVWNSGANTTPLKTLEIKFTHAYSSLSLSPSTTCTVNNGTTTSCTTSSVSDVSFTLGTEPLLPYQVVDGSYRIIVSPQTTATTVRWLCNYKSEMHSGTIPAATTFVANTRYTLAPILGDIGEYTLDNAQVGDFYCKSSDGSTGYLIPGGVSLLTAEQQTACLGVVYWVGNDAVKEDPLLKANHSDCTHGLVVALHNASDKTKWSSKSENITNLWLSKLESPTYVITTLVTTNKMQGYANTKALDGYNQSERVIAEPQREVLPIGFIQTYANSHPAPANSSNWYFPSIKELKYMCWGQNASGENSDGMAMLNRQFEKVSGSSLPSVYYWSSTEYGDNVRCVSFNGGLYNKTKGLSCKVRAVLAF